MGTSICVGIVAAGHSTACLAALDAWETEPGSSAPLHRRGAGHVLGQDGEVELASRDLLGELVGVHALALVPELSQQAAGLAAGEPGSAELLAELSDELSSSAQARR